MKIRWTEDSIRLRITPSELESLLAGQPFAAGISFPGGALWRLVVQTDDSPSRVESVSGSVLLIVSAEDRAKFADSDCEGIVIGFGESGSHRCYLEKNFPCAHPRGPQEPSGESETFTPTSEYRKRKQQ